MTMSSPDICGVDFFQECILGPTDPFTILELLMFFLFLNYLKFADLLILKI